ncbi:hypothetical protein IFR04_006643 [Cadophora malorum]|uniref:Uncharacterized protein n=1 Tax=Cadophora malorum TaxID=108018 RepID=A0A8H7W7Q7_9HELO|nr:hypothetical protein IFR04_006643 [Cadophora malorum]
MEDESAKKNEATTGKIKPSGKKANVIDDAPITASQSNVQAVASTFTARPHSEISQSSTDRPATSQRSASGTHHTTGQLRFKPQWTITSNRCARCERRRLEGCNVDKKYPCTTCQRASETCEEGQPYGDFEKPAKETGNENEANA